MTDNRQVQAAHMCEPQVPKHPKASCVLPPGRDHQAVNAKGTGDQARTATHHPSLCPAKLPMPGPAECPATLAIEAPCASLPQEPSQRKGLRHLRSPRWERSLPFTLPRRGDSSREGNRAEDDGKQCQVPQGKEENLEKSSECRGYP